MLELLVKVSCGSFTELIVRLAWEAGLGGETARDDLLGFCIVMEVVVYSKGIGMYLHLSCPW